MVKKKKAIEIRNLKKYYTSVFGLGKKVKAVDGVSFDVFKGEIFGFLGPNGAGKTTTIRCMMDFLRPSEGEIKIFGLDSHKHSVELKKRLGYLPGNVRLYNNWTGWDHVKFVRSLRGGRDRASELAQRLSLDLSKKFRELSSGNKQKLGIVLALMSEPELLIMDEPTIGLDPLLQNEIYKILRELKQKGVTIFVSSHNLSEVEKICDRVGIIKQGKMVAVETLADLSGKKLHKVEVRFLNDVKVSEIQFDGIENITKIPDGFSFNVSGDINLVLKQLSRHKISDITISHADLEEIFLRFYQKDK